MNACSESSGGDAGVPLGAESVLYELPRAWRAALVGLSGVFDGARDVAGSAACVAAAEVQAPCGALYSSLPNGDEFVPCAASTMQIHRLYGVPIPTLRAEHLFTPPPEALRNRRFLVGGEWAEYDPGVLEWVVRLNDGYCQERRRTDRSVAMQQERYKFVLDAINGAVIDVSA